MRFESRYISPPRDSEDNRPRFKSYDEELDHLTVRYYHLWAHRTDVTIRCLKEYVGLLPTFGVTYRPRSTEWLAVWSALRMHGIDY